MRLLPAEAALLADQLELDYATTPVCPACLTIVSFPLDLGREREARREAAALAPDFWKEGLDEVTRLALEEARERGVDRAAEALAELGRFGARSEVVTAVILRLADAQVDEMRSRRRR